MTDDDRIEKAYDALTAESCAYLGNFAGAAIVMKEAFWKVRHRLTAAERVIQWAKESTKSLTADEQQKVVGIPGSPDPIFELKAALRDYEKICLKTGGMGNGYTKEGKT